MKSNLDAVKPSNVTAQLRYAGAGNPPSVHPETAVGNFFPGLEFNFQNVWKRFFKGLEVLESSNEVIGLDPDTTPDGLVEELNTIFEEGRNNLWTDLHLRIASVDGVSLLLPVTGPRQVGGAIEQLAATPMEWSNALAKAHAVKSGTPGQTVACVLYVTYLEPDGSFNFRPLGPYDFEVNSLVAEASGLISPESVLPGEITESLCSPWQTDYIGCACYYWASNRPDYVNITEDSSAGNHWLNVSRREENGKPFYSLNPDENLKHEDVMQDWESKFQFVLKGQDVVDGVVPVDDDNGN